MRVTFRYCTSYTVFLSAQRKKILGEGLLRVRHSLVSDENKSSGNLHNPNFKLNSVEGNVHDPPTPLFLFLKQF